MKFYLVQHGQAKPKEMDPERPLSETGTADLGKITAFINTNVYLKAATIFHSGKLRAKQTAEILAKQIKPMPGVSQAEGLDPTADPTIWVDRLKGMQEDIILVGHLPHLDRLASLLLVGDQDRSVVTFHNAGIVCLVRDDNKRWSIDWIVTPEILK
jgi:phosphohistidine phosphatase